MTHVPIMVVVAAFPVLVIWAAVSDFFTMTISNRVSLALVVAAGLALALTGASLVDVGWHLAAAAIVFAIGFGCFAFGWIGGGDVKFATAVAFWLGWSDVLAYALGFSLWGGLLTLLVLFSDRVLDPLPALRVGFLAGFAQHRRVPYGIALAVAGLQVFAETPFMKVFL